MKKPWGSHSSDRSAVLLSLLFCNAVALEASRLDKPKLRASAPRRRLIPRAPAKTNEEPGPLPIMAMFQDSIKDAMPEEWAQVEVDRPDSHGANIKSYQYMAPQFADLNGDGKLDMVLPNHCSRCRITNIMRAVGRWSEDNGTTVDTARLKLNGLEERTLVKSYCDSVWGWDLGLASIDDRATPMGRLRYEPVRPEHGHVHITDDMWSPMRKALAAPGGLLGDEGKGIADVEGRLWMADAHGFAVVDLDGDGKQDVMITIGANRGVGKSASDRNALLWGDGNATHWRLTGGRDQAQFAGVDSFLGRSRGVTLFDADNDGVLDMYISNVAREDDLIVPSVLLVSGGRSRQWKMAPGSRQKGNIQLAGPLSQYTVKAVLADADADGHMNELVMALSDCPEKASMQPHNRHAPHLDPSSEHVVQEDPGKFCNDRTPSSLVVLKLDGTGSAATYTYKFPNIRNFKLVSADIDNDGVADLLVLQQLQVLAFLSASVKPGNMLFDAKPVTVARLGSEIVPVDFALADFDLDGDLDMFVLGEHPGTSHTFTNVGQKNGYFYRDLDMFGVESIPSQRGSKPAAVGVTVSDLDNDGYPDIYVAYNRASGILLKNHAAEVYRQAGLTPPDLVSFSLAGNLANHQGIGASVVLHTTPLPTGIRRQLRQVSVAQRSGGHDDSRLVFTLGRGSQVERLVVTWPSGYVQTVLPDEIGRAHIGSITDPHIIEDSAVVALGGRLRGCLKAANGTVLDATSMRFALSQHATMQEPAEISKLRSTFAHSRSGVAKHTGVFVFRSTGRLHPPARGKRPGRFRGGVPHTPARAGKVGEIRCSNGIKARTHLLDDEEHQVHSFPVRLSISKPSSPHGRPYGMTVNRLPRDGLPDPCSAEAPREIFYQLVDTATCAMSSVFQYTSEQCCNDLTQWGRA